MSKIQAKETSALNTTYQILHTRAFARFRPLLGFLLYFLLHSPLYWQSCHVDEQAYLHPNVNCTAVIALATSNEHALPYNLINNTNTCSE